MSHALCSFSRLFGGSTPPFIGRFLPRCDACPSRVVDKIRRNTAVIAWGVASFLAMVLCGWFGILLLRLTGLKGVPAEQPPESCRQLANAYSLGAVAPALGISLRSS
jgi:hypothetical protein